MLSLLTTWFQTRRVCLLVAPGVSDTAVAPRKALSCLRLHQGGHLCRGPQAMGREVYLEFVEMLYSLFSSIQCFQWRTQSYSLGLLSYSKLVKSHLFWQNTTFAPTVILVSSIRTSILSVFLIIYSWGYFHISGPIGNSKELACPVWLITRFNS